MLAAGGARVAINYKSRSAPADALSLELGERGFEHMVLRADVTQERAVGRRDDAAGSGAPTRKRRRQLSRRRRVTRLRLAHAWTGMIGGTWPCHEKSRRGVQRTPRLR